MGNIRGENLYITDFFVRSNGVQSNDPPKSHRPAPLPHGVRREVPLAPLTSMRVGGQADCFAEAHSEDELQSLLAWAHGQRLPVSILGGGTNVLVHDKGVRGLVIRLHAARAIPRVEHHSRHAIVRLVGGAQLVDSVHLLLEQNLFGIETLYGIPGSVGAAAAQNVGAYGQEICETLLDVEVVHLATAERRCFFKEALGFDYRYSHLRAGDGLWSGQYVVTAVTLELSKQRQRPIAFPALVQALQQAGIDPQSSTPKQIGQQVWRLRRERGMVWPTEGPSWGTVGSFFKNPVVHQEQGQALVRENPKMPFWPVRHGLKLSAAWLIEAAGFARGWHSNKHEGRVGLSPLHALALVNHGAASATAIVDVATMLHAQVLHRFGIALVAEAQCLGFAATAPPFVRTPS